MVLRRSQGGGRFLMSEVPLYGSACRRVYEPSTSGLFKKSLCSPLGGRIKKRILGRSEPKIGGLGLLLLLLLYSRYRS